MPTYIIEREIPGAARAHGGRAARDHPAVQRRGRRASSGRTRGATATWPATRSTACTRPRARRSSSSTAAAAASRSTWWPRSRAVFDSTGPRDLPGLTGDPLPGAGLTLAPWSVMIGRETASGRGCLAALAADASRAAARSCSSPAVRPASARPAFVEGTLGGRFASSSAGRRGRRRRAVRAGRRRPARATCGARRTGSPPCGPLRGRTWRCSSPSWARREPTRGPRDAVRGDPLRPAHDGRRATRPSCCSTTSTPPTRPRSSCSPALAPTLDELPLLIVAAYRSDDLARSHPLRRLRHDLRRDRALD